MYVERDDIIVNLTVTRRCYARCRGCINRSLTFAGDEVVAEATPDCDPLRDTQLVVRIANHHPQKSLTLCYYGGEPFLAPDRMDDIRRLLEKSPAGGRLRYMVYTTGELIGANIARFPELMRSIWLYSISIDGGAEQHSRARPGTSLAKIVQSLEKLRCDHDGHILCWSTLREDQSLLDCFLQFRELYSNGLVNHMFWHWADSIEPFADINSYASRYTTEMEQVMEAYTECLYTGELLPLAHINELVLYLLTARERGHTACGVELAQNYDVLDGVVHACADLPSSIGAVSRNGAVMIDPQALRSLTAYKEGLGCYRCEAHFYCGGRCPVQALAGSPERTRQVCRLMRLHVSLVKEHIGEISRLLNRHHITAQQVYDRSALIARYTDVVP